MGLISVGTVTLQAQIDDNLSGQLNVIQGWIAFERLDESRGGQPTLIRLEDKHQ